MCSRVTQLVLLAAVIVLAAALARKSHEASHVALAADGARSAPAVLLTSAESPVTAEPEVASLLGSFDVLVLDPEMLLTPESAAFAQAAVNPQDPNSKPEEIVPPQPAGDRPAVGRGGPAHDGEWRDGRAARPGGEGERFDRDRGRERGPWSQHGPRMLMNPEMIARCLEVASEVDQELGTRLAESRQKNPEEFDRSMRAGGFGRRLLALAELKQRDPDLYRAKLGELSQAVQIERTAKQLREARKNGSQGEIDLYEQDLRKLLQNQLAMSIKARTELLCRLDERIAELRGEIERDAQNFQGIIDARLKVLASERPAQPGPAPQAAPAEGAAEPQ